ncbi:sodium:alanine symporter family protein [Bacillus licheniformis]|nr:sodium:alanine symporter family protein [Bacillus licheniformis]
MYYIEHGLGRKFKGLAIAFALFGAFFLTIVLKGLQFRRLIYAFKIGFGKEDSKDAAAEGDVSHFKALMTALAATIGNGNIAGVATALTLGGKTNVSDYILCRFTNITIFHCDRISHAAMKALSLSGVSHMDILEILGKINKVLWGPPSLILLFGTGFCRPPQMKYDSTASINL